MRLIVPSNLTVRLSACTLAGDGGHVDYLDRCSTGCDPNGGNVAWRGPALRGGTCDLGPAGPGDSPRDRVWVATDDGCGWR